MLAALADPAVAVRRTAARALAPLGDGDAFAPLQAARAVESDADAAFYLDETMAALLGGAA